MSVFFRMLPFLEQMALFQRWDHSLTADSQANTLSLSTNSGVSIPSFITCPSSGALIIKTGDANANCYASCYIGISGAMRGATASLSTSPPYEVLARVGNDGDWTDLGATANPNQGHGANVNGAIVFGEHKGMESLTDGTSNTFCFGESAWQPQTTNASGSGNMYRSWIRGAFIYNRYILQFSSKNLRDQNMYLINDIKKNPSAGWATHITITTTNSPNAYHSGGANFALVDGSIRFVSETLAPTVYLAYGCGNDGDSYSLP